MPPGALKILPSVPHPGQKQEINPQKLGVVKQSGLIVIYCHGLCIQGTEGKGDSSLGATGIASIAEISSGALAGQLDCRLYS
jgi:hypothetical protein